jgi:hypothetical protein
MTRRSHAVEPAAMEVVRLATEAHLAAALGWPHHARRAALAASAAADHLAVELSAWCQAQPEHIEDTERRSAAESALAEAEARYARRRDPAPDTERTQT